MGQVFQRTYKAADGTVKTCETWTIRYFRNGRPYQEATTFKHKGKALGLLKVREGDIAKGLPVCLANLRLTFDDASNDVVNDFTANRKRSLAVVERRINKHLLPTSAAGRCQRLPRPTSGRMWRTVRRRAS